ncbi:MAG: class F sortase [Anaerolineae bacterium]
MSVFRIWIVFPILACVLAACDSSQTIPAAMALPLPSETATIAAPTATPTRALATATPKATATPTRTPTRVPTATPQPTPYGGGRPASMSIPAIGIKDANVVDVGLEANGAMETPKGWWDLGWYKLGPLPGQLGNSVISGHLDSDTGPAVFWNLGRLRKGDKIVVEMEDGTKRSFAVEKLESYPYNKAPLDRIFGASDRARLNLITCAGVFDKGHANYSNRLVVYAVAEQESAQ